MEQIGGGQQGQPDVERGRAFGNLGTCYDSLGDYEEGVKVLMNRDELKVGLRLREYRLPLALFHATSSQPFGFDM